MVVVVEVKFMVGGIGFCSEFIYFDCWSIVVINLIRFLGQHLKFARATTITNGEKGPFCYDCTMVLLLAPVDSTIERFIMGPL